MDSNNQKPATEKQLEWLRAMMGFRVFRSEDEVLLREEIMQWLKGKELSMSQASAYIAACLNLPKREYVPCEKRKKSGRVFRARTVWKGRMTLKAQG